MRLASRGGDKKEFFRPWQENLFKKSQTVGRGREEQQKRERNMASQLGVALEEHVGKEMFAFLQDFNIQALAGRSIDEITSTICGLSGSGGVLRISRIESSGTTRIPGTTGFPRSVSTAIKPGIIMRSEPVREDPFVSIGEGQVDRISEFPQ